MYLHVIISWRLSLYDLAFIRDLGSQLYIQKHTNGRFIACKFQVRHYIPYVNMFMD
jgi:hypothetical protein